MQEFRIFGRLFNFFFKALISRTTGFVDKIKPKKYEQEALEFILKQIDEPLIVSDVTANRILEMYWDDLHNCRQIKAGKHNQKTKSHFLKLRKPLVFALYKKFVHLLNTNSRMLPTETVNRHKLSNKVLSIFHFCHYFYFPPLCLYIGTENHALLRVFFPFCHSHQKHVNKHANEYENFTAGWSSCTVFDCNSGGTGSIPSVSTYLF